jgi:cytochrome c oxidase subunit 4
MNRQTAKPLLTVWVLLLVLLALTLTSAFFRLGIGNMLINFGIALLKSLLVVLVFMHMKGSPALYRLVVLTGLFTLALLLLLSQTDYLTRIVYRAPFQTPQTLPAELGRLPARSVPPARPAP